MPERFREFNPAEWHYIDYIGAASSEGDKNKRIVAVLRQSFTPLCVELERLALEKAGNIAAAPISGNEPRVSSYIHPHLSHSLDDYGFERIDQYASSTQPVNGGLSDLHIYVPIGRYGRRIAFATAHAARALYRIVIEEMSKDYEEVDRQYGQILGTETFRRNSILTQLEGIQTHVGVFGLLIADRIPDYANPLEMYQKLLENDLFNDFALRLPNSIAAKMFKGGFRFRQQTLETTHMDGKKGLRFTDELKRFLADLKQHHTANNRSVPGERQLGCPMGYEGAFDQDGEALENSGIHQVAEAMYPYIEYFYQNFQD